MLSNGSHGIEYPNVYTVQLPGELEWANPFQLAREPYGVYTGEFSDPDHVDVPHNIFSFESLDVSMELDVESANSPFDKFQVMPEQILGPNLDEEPYSQAGGQITPADSQIQHRGSPPPARSDAEIVQPAASFLCAVVTCPQRCLFSRKCDFDRHMDKHKRPYACSESGCKVKPFGDKGGLQRHRREVHNIDDEGKRSKKFTCPETGCKRNRRSFARRSNMLEHHRRVHALEKSQTVTSSASPASVRTSETASDSDKSISTVSTILVMNDGKGNGSSDNALRERLEAEVDKLKQERTRAEEKLAMLSEIINAL